MIFGGIDPGLSGGIAAIDETGCIVLLEPAPTRATEKGEEMDLSLMRDCLSRLFLSTQTRGQFSMRFMIEKATSMPKQGVVSTFKFGKGFGEWRGMMFGLGVSFEMTTPQAWKKALLAGMPKEKEASIQRAQELFPNAALIPKGCRVAKDGMAEALLIAEFNRRRG